MNQLPELITKLGHGKIESFLDQYIEWEFPTPYNLINTSYSITNQYK